MPLQVTVDIFSGRPNPVITLADDEARPILERLASETGAPFTRAVSPPRPRLGYRGLIVEQVSKNPEPTVPSTFRLAAGEVIASNLMVRPTDPELEEYVLDPTGPIGGPKMGTEIAGFCLMEARRLRTLKRLGPLHPKRSTAALMLSINAAGCENAPVFEPEWWNDGGQKQLSNNCYNYSTNYRTDTFAQPGRGTGLAITALSCAVVKPLAMADGLIESPWTPNQCPLFGHLVALVVAPGFDFHWYRKGWGGLWTHKIGIGVANAVDNSDNLIADPREADRGPYVSFCGFMVVNHGHIKLR